VDLSTKEQVEIDFWANSPTEKPGTETIENLLNKMTDAPVLLERMRPFAEHFASAKTILELGAGQGWASCLVKRLYPQARVIATDISPHAIASIGQWERIFQVKVDDTAACRSYEIPVAGASVDVIFCFAAAHHFVAHRRTLAEIARILRPGGRCFYFHEPSCTRFMYPAAYRRVNRIRPEVPEDVLRYREIKELAQATGLEAHLHSDTSLLKRGQVEYIYYFMLRGIKVLQMVLPCTRDYEFVKPLPAQGI
jgi:SAM-dependent methyltransferase